MIESYELVSVDELAGLRLSPAEREAALYMAGTGKTSKELGDRLNSFSPTALISRLRRKGVPVYSRWVNSGSKRHKIYISVIAKGETLFINDKEE